MSRLTARFWIDAYLTRLRLNDIPVFIVAHGDDTAGSILVKLNTLDGTASVFQRRYDLASDAYIWEEIVADAESVVDAQISQARSRDPDLWVIEVEDRAGRHLLHEPGFS